MILWILLPGAPLHAQQRPLIRQIDITGNRKVDEATIRLHLRTRVGDEFSVERTREDVRALYRLGFFDDVQVSAVPFEGGIRLTYAVRERPTIAEVEVRGNEKVKTEKIRERIALAEGTVLAPAALTENAEKIRRYYEDENFFQATVTARTEPVRDQQVRVIFEITEGEKFHLAQIRILGAHGLTEKEIIKRMVTSERFLFFFGGTLKREELERDLDRIRALYLSRGYLEVKVGEPTVTLNTEERTITVTIQVEEGPQFRVGRVAVSGNTLFSTNEILGSLESVPESTFSRETLQKDVLTLIDRYGEQGYLFADVTPQITTHAERHAVDVVLQVLEGKRAFVERVEISGNVRTRDKVIRREITLAEGDVYDSRLLRESRRNLVNLGFFEDFKVEANRGSAEDLVVVNVGVKEKPTGSLSVGGGYSSVNGAEAVASVSESNLFGQGKRVSLSGILGERVTRFDLRYADPYLFDTSYSLDLHAFNIQQSFRTFQGFDEDARGANVGVGRRLFEEVRGSLTYGYERVRIFNLAADVPSLIRAQEGASETSSLTLGFVRDTVDNRFEPTRGLRLSSTTKWAGTFLGGTHSFVKQMGEASYFHPLFWKVVGHLRGVIGYVSSLDEIFGKPVRDVPVAERFFLGGIGSIRGYRNFSVGPVDPATGGRLGGTQMFFTNVEALFPLYDPINLKGLVFFDAGNTFSEDEHFELSFRTSAGMGLRFTTPVGPIRVEWGYKLNRKPGEGSNAFHFTIGAVF